MVNRNTLHHWNANSRWRAALSEEAGPKHGAFVRDTPGIGNRFVAGRLGQKGLDTQQ